MRVLVTGSRTWDDDDRIAAALHTIDQGNTLPDNPITLVSGHCPTGADATAERVARILGWDVELHPAQWDKYGRGAGPIRNKEMVDLGASVCVAFIHNGSKGASHTAKIAEEAGIRTVRYTA